MTLAQRLADFLAGQSLDVFRKKKHSREPIVVKASSGGATIFITALVTRVGETGATPEVDLCGVDEPIWGIIVGIAWEATDFAKDSDSPYADGTYLLMDELEEGDEFVATAATNTAISFGVECEVSGGFVIPSAGDGLTPPTSIVGKCMVAVTATASTEKLTYFKK